jgi:hypothetical protein
MTFRAAQARRRPAALQDGTVTRRDEILPADDVILAERTTPFPDQPIHARGDHSTDYCRMPSTKIKHTVSIEKHLRGQKQ